MTNLVQKPIPSSLFFPPAFQGSAPQITGVRITPDVAREMLAKTDQSIQRKIKRSQVKYLIRQLEEGKWKMNGDTIRVDVNGNVIDGQHRLTACVESGIPFDTYIIFGIDDKAMPTIDRGGAQRTLADIMKINDGTSHKYENTVVSIANFCYNFANGRYGMAGSGTGSSSRITMDANDFLEWVEKNPSVFNFTADAMSIRSNGDKLISAKVFCGLFWIIKNRDTGFGLVLPESDYANKCEQYFSGLSDGVGIKRENIIWQIRRRLMAHHGKTKDVRSDYLTPSKIIWLILKGWEWYVKGEYREMIRIPQKVDSLPEVF